MKKWFGTWLEQDHRPVWDELNSWVLDLTDALVVYVVQGFSTFFNLRPNSDCYKNSKDHFPK